MEAAVESNPRATERPYEWLTPSRVLNWGYSMYVASAEKYRRTEHRVAALEVIRHMRDLTSGKLSREDQIFVSAMHEIALSYSTGIPRKNSIFDAHLAKAKEELAEAKKDDYENEKFAIALRFFFKFVIPYGFLAILGASLAKVVGIVIPEEVSTATGTRAPSFVAAFFFVFIGNLISRWWKKLHEDRVDDRYNARVLQAIEVHEDGRRQEIRKHWADAAACWAAYTMKSLPKDISSYQNIIDEEIRAQKMLRRQEKELGISDVRRFLIQPVRKVLGKLRRKKNGKNRQKVSAVPEKAA